jgi:hypothetical protein
MSLVPEFADFLLPDGRIYVSALSSPACPSARTYNTPTELYVIFINIKQEIYKSPSTIYKAIWFHMRMAYIFHCPSGDLLAAS